MIDDHADRQLTSFARVVVASLVAVDSQVTVSSAPDDDYEVDDGDRTDQDAVENEVDIPPKRKDGFVGSRRLFHGIFGRRFQPKSQSRRSRGDGVDPQSGYGTQRVNGNLLFVEEGQSDNQHQNFGDVS